MSFESESLPRHLQLQLAAREANRTDQYQRAQLRPQLTGGMGSFETSQEDVEWIRRTTADGNKLVLRSRATSAERRHRLPGAQPKGPNRPRSAAPVTGKQLMFRAGGAAGSAAVHSAAPATLRTPSLMTSPPRKEPQRLAGALLAPTGVRAQYRVWFSVIDAMADY